MKLILVQTELDRGITVKGYMWLSVICIEIMKKTTTIMLLISVYKFFMVNDNSTH